MMQVLLQDQRSPHEVALHLWQGLVLNLEQDGVIVSIQGSVTCTLQLPGGPLLSINPSNLASILITGVWPEFWGGQISGEPRDNN